MLIIIWALYVHSFGPEPGGMDVTGEGGTGSAVVSVDIALADGDGVGGLRAQVGVLYGSC